MIHKHFHSFSVLGIQLSLGSFLFELLVHGQWVQGFELHTAIHDPLHVFNIRELPLTQPPVNNTINTLQGKAGKSSRGGNCPLFRLFAFSISLSMIRFSAIINL